MKHFSSKTEAQNTKRSSVTFGAVEKKVEVEGFILRHVSHAPYTTLPYHDHENATITFMLKGAYNEIFRNKSWGLKPSNIIIKPAGEHHANKFCSSGAQSLVIEVLPTRLEAIHRYTSLFNSTSYIEGGILSALARKIYREFQIMDCGVSELTIEGLILEMLAQQSRQKTKNSNFLSTPTWFHKAQDFIHANFAGRISLSDIARESGVNPAYLAKNFRHYTGYNVGAYVKNLQLEYAIRQLKETETSLAEIAASAGFYDQSHFTNAFKRCLKIAPAEFRALNR